jgi:hypothetical protein
MTSYFHAGHQLLYRQLIDANAADWGKRAAEDVVVSVIVSCALNRPEVHDLLDDADLAGIALWVAADQARELLSQVIAGWAGLEVLLEGDEGISKRFGERINVLPDVH